jgi:very-short-patch-repair endonuclease
MLKYNSQLKQYSKKLRYEMTDAERLLWQKIRRKQLRGYQFFRQKPIGKYIVDFYCPRARLIIEIDGGQHYEDSRQAEDKKRDSDLKSIGFKVVRYTNLDILKNLNNAVEDILKILLFEPEALRAGWPNPPL